MNRHRVVGIVIGVLFAVSIGTLAQANGPIAFAFIDDTGAVLSGTGNLACSWNPDQEWYEISVAGEDIYYTDYVTIVTPSYPMLTDVSSVMGMQIVQLLDPDTGLPVAGMFSIAIFKPAAPVAAGVPIAFGYVASDGTIFASSGNISCLLDEFGYNVFIDGEDYYYTDYVTLVTPTYPVLADVGSIGGALLVNLYDLAGQEAFSDFWFVTYKP